MALINLYKTTPKINTIDPYKIHYNVGSLLDIPTGEYVIGARGENILNGGLGVLTGLAGKPNSYKSTLSSYMVLKALDTVINSGYLTHIYTYDTENTKLMSRLKKLASQFNLLKDMDLFDRDNLIWYVSDATLYKGDQWFANMKELLKDKCKQAKSFLIETPFIDHKGVPISTMLPTFGEVDSLSHFATSSLEKITDEDIGEAGRNRIYMKMGLDKSSLVMELMSLCNTASWYTVLTSHVGKDGTMATGPHQVPTKTMQYQKLGEKYKGVPDNFLQLCTVFLEISKSSLEINQTTKGLNWPKTRDSVDEGSTDLNRITVKVIRNKAGGSGGSVDLIVSQTEGVLPSLSEFVHIHEERYGISGNNTTYHLDLYPSENIQRTTVRSLLDNDPKMRRAVKITSDLLQIKKTYKTLKYEVPDPKDLYTFLESKFGMDTILNTRDNWTFDQYTNPVPFLSTMDIIKMYHTDYKPYWM